MSATRPMNPETASAAIPEVPLTLEGFSVLHQMMRFRWSAWHAVPKADRDAMVHEAIATLAPMEQSSSGQSAIYSLLGHKGDLMLIHFRNSFDDLNQAELDLGRLKLSDFLEPTSSYLSIIELGLYESTLKVYRSLADRGVEPHSDDWNRRLTKRSPVKRRR